MSKTAEQIAQEVVDSLRAAEREWSRIVQPGDLIDCRDDRTFLSGARFLTGGKLYRVERVSRAGDRASAMVECDIPGEMQYSLGNTNLIIRDGMVVWNWHEFMQKFHRELDQAAQEAGDAQE